jgi:hypothetical protein
MPLRDHFRPPIPNKGSWEGFHGMWPATMVMDLCKTLPSQYTAEPRVHLTELYEYEVLIFDQQRGRELVAAIEIVSPANKDRPQTRAAFVSKCAALLQRKVCVSIVDLVTIKHFNLYCEVLDVFGQSDPAFAPERPSTYAVTCRSHKLGTESRFESWAYPMVIDKPLPILPIWLDDDQAISLDLEVSYQQACTVLRLV